MEKLSAQIIFQPITILYFFLAIITLSGFGIIFLNEESILAICFFIFLFLVVKNSSTVYEALVEQKEVIKYIFSIYLGKTNIKAIDYKTSQIGVRFNYLLGLKRVFRDSDSKIISNR